MCVEPLVSCSTTAHAVSAQLSYSDSACAGGKGFGDPVTFDNAYYSALLQKPWLNTKDEMATHIGLPSDHALPEDAECNAMIQEYAADQQAFFRDFAGAYAKLSITGAQWA